MPWSRPSRAHFLYKVGTHWMRASRGFSDEKRHVCLAFNFRGGLHIHHMRQGRGNCHNDRTVAAGVTCLSHSLSPVLPARTLVGEWKGLRRNCSRASIVSRQGWRWQRPVGLSIFRVSFRKARGQGPSLATGSRPPGGDVKKTRLIRNMGLLLAAQKGGGWRDAGREH